MPSSPSPALTSRAVATNAPPLSDSERQALSRVVLIGNAKGGVGKTSLATNLAGLLAAAGYSTLLVDLDPQGSSGQNLVPGWPEGDNGLTSDQGQGILNVVATGQASMLETALLKPRTNLDFVCGGPELKGVDDLLAGESEHPARPGSKRFALAKSLAAIAPRYDFIILDTPPGDHHLLRLGLIAARWLVIPTRSDRLSIMGMHNITDEVLAARKDNPTLDLLGIALTASGTSATRVRTDALRDINDVFWGAAPLFKNVIRSAEATANQTPRRGRLAHELADDAKDEVPFYQALRNPGMERPSRLPSTVSALAEDYLMLSEEIVRRIASFEESEEAMSAAAADGEA